MKFEFFLQRLALARGTAASAAHTATRCNTLQNIVPHTQHTLQHTATHCNTLQRTAKHYNTLQHTLQHTTAASAAQNHTALASIANTLQGEGVYRVYTHHYLEDPRA